MSETKRYGKLTIVVLLVLGMVLGGLFVSNIDLLSDRQSIGRSFMPVVSADQRSLQEFSETFARIAEKVKPSVVLIRSKRVVRAAQQQLRNPFEEFFGGTTPRRQEPRTDRGLGSGVIVSEDGYILTNNHVVDKADELTVYLSDERELKAEVVGTDPRTDLAVIKVDSDDLPVLSFGDSEQLRVGEWVMAVGNPFGLSHTVTAGIVSAKGRKSVLGGDSYQNFIQTDAAINPGNSGGALVDLEGNLMGINTAIYSRTGGYQGIGFAVPANMARDIMTRLIEDGKITRGFLGVEISDLDADLAASMGLDDDKGVLIANVIKGGPAVDSDIQKDDVVLALNGIEVEDSDALRNRIADFPPGTEIELEIYRDGRRKMVEIELGELPDNPSQLASSEGPEKSPASNIGIDVMNISREWTRYYEMGSGVVIAKVVAGSVAEDKGLRRGELITEVNGEPVSNVREFVSIIRQFDAGEAIRFRVQRGEQQRLVGIRIPVE
ncbi:MAG: DegQ family serine endoprotease [Gemmatimonadota bacterium]|nr:DegQ family serine endoprotease [Gemmatimonadota bacterium]